MTVIDLTHTISEDMPVYPGTAAPKLTVPCTVERDGFRETLLRMFSHTGTHVDAPAHLIEKGKTLERFEASQFVGSALVIDCTGLKEGESIDISLVRSYGELAEKADFLLFRTDWDSKWGTAAYFGAFPCITEEVADFIISSRKKGIGLDLISLDPVGSDLPNHMKILSQNTIVIIENLCNLKCVGSGLFTLIAAPLKFENADGAPIRALAIID